jgi:hypothetical protein
VFNFAESRVDRIKKALTPLGFDSTDYTDGWDCVVLTAAGAQKASEKHPLIKAAGLQVYASSGSPAKIGLPQAKTKKKSGFVKVKPKKVR